MTLPSAFNIEAIGEWCGASSDVIATAAASPAPKLVISGRLSSGKDTVAEEVMRVLGREDSIRVSFATALREEIADIMNIIREAQSLDQAIDQVAVYAEIERDEAVATTTALAQGMEENPSITPYTRTKEMRFVLQTWGTEVRRRHDDAYWVKQGSRQALEALAAGHPVHITDARFVNEVEIAQGMGFWAVRLEVDTAIRAARLMARDGLELDPIAEAHPSEAQLGEFVGFDQRVSNDGELTNTVAPIVAALRLKTVNPY